jgi:transcriptional regulator with XRE-family HTH domain
MPGGENGIGQRLKAARLRRGLSREALAFHSGISWSAIAQVEAGRRTNLRPTTLAALAGALAVTIDYLVTGRPPANGMLEHRVLLYEADSVFLDTATRFLTEANERSEAAIAVADPDKLALLRERLDGRADGVVFAERATWYRSPVAALAGYREFLDQALHAGVSWVRILGEPAWASSSSVEAQLWARYESLLNLLFSGAPVTVLCTYDRRELNGKIVEHAQSTHPHLVEKDAVVPSPAYTEPGEFMLQL